MPFPFTDQTASKKRPAVIVSNLAYNQAKPDVVVMAVTSQFRPSPSLGEVWIAQWQAAGLLKPSAIKPVFATLEQRLHHSPTRRARRRRSTPGRPQEDDHRDTRVMAPSLEGRQPAATPAASFEGRVSPSSRRATFGPDPLAATSG